MRGIIESLNDFANIVQVLVKFNPRSIELASISRELGGEEIDVTVYFIAILNRTSLCGLLLHLFFCLVLKSGQHGSSTTNTSDNNWRGSHVSAGGGCSDGHPAAGGYQGSLCCGGFGSWSLSQRQELPS